MMARGPLVESHGDSILVGFFAGPLFQTELRRGRSVRGEIEKGTIPRSEPSSRESALGLKVPTSYHYTFRPRSQYISNGGCILVLEGPPPRLSGISIVAAVFLSVWACHR